MKVGTVKSIEYDSYENSYYALIDVFEDIKKVSDVFVVIDFRGKGLIDISESDSQNQGEK